MREKAPRFLASLGSIETPPSVAARIEFWHGLHERLAQLPPARRRDAGQGHEHRACPRPHGHAGREGGAMVTGFLNPPPCRSRQRVT